MLFPPIYALKVSADISVFLPISVSANISVFLADTDILFENLRSSHTFSVNLFFCCSPWAGKWTISKKNDVLLLLFSLWLSTINFTTHTFSVFKNYLKIHEKSCTCAKMSFLRFNYWKLRNFANKPHIYAIHENISISKNISALLSIYQYR